MKPIKFEFIKKPCSTGLLLLLLFISACSPVSVHKPFNPRTCMDESPNYENKIQLLQGERTHQNIAQDMHPAWCHGQVLLRQMYERGHAVTEGTILMKVTVEYTGEVISVRILESDIPSSEFRQKISDMVMDSDFIPWKRSDQDTVFIYPMTFDFWWEKTTDPENR